MSFVFGTRLVIINIVLFFIAVLFLFQSYRRPGICGAGFVIVASISILLFCVFAFWSGDFYSLGELIPYVREGYDVHIERAYKYIINNVTSDYIQFRFIVWGLGLLCFIISAKRLKLHLDITLFTLTCFYLPMFSYARVSCAMSIILLATTFLTQPLKRKQLSFLIFFVLLFISYFFHKSAFFGVFAVLLTLFLKNDKKQIVILLVLFPLFVIITQYILGDFMQIESEGELFDTNTAQQYLSRDSKYRGPGELVERFLYMTPFYLISYIYYKSIERGFFNKQSNIDISFYARMGFVIVLISSIFSFNLNAYTSFLHYRFLNFAMLPYAIFMSYCRTNNILSRMTSITYVIGFLATTYILVYALYCASF